MAHRLYSQFSMNITNVKILVSLTFFIIAILFSILITLSPWNSINEIENQILTTVEAKKTRRPLIDLGAATTPYNELEGMYGYYVHSNFQKSYFLGCETVGWWPTNWKSVGDDICNDNLNVEVCNYDNGDCCLSEISDDQCTECICHEDGTRHPSRTTTTEELRPCPNFNNAGWCIDDQGVLWESVTTMAVPW